MFYSDEPVEADPDDSVQEDMSEGDTSTENNTDLDDANQDKTSFHIQEQDQDQADDDEEEEGDISQSSDGDLESLNTSNSSFVQHPSSPFNLRLPWKHEPVVMELLQYYTDQGDIQMCVTLYLVLEKYLNIDNERIEDWFTAYIELLHRFKLWSTATAIIKACKVQNVRERNEVK